MDNSWVKLYRKLSDNEVMFDPTALQIFIWLLLRVDKKTGTTTVGRYLIGMELHLNPNTVYSALQRLEKKYKIATQDSNNRFTTISLLNWANYQATEHLSTQVIKNQSKTNQKPINTIQDYRSKKIDNDKSLQTWGNPDINLLISYMKEKLGLPLLDESEQTNRRYANLCIKKFGLDKTKLAVDATAHSKFWHTKITSYKGLYYNAIKIVSSNRGEVRSVDATKVLDSKNEGRQGISVIGGGVQDTKRSLAGGIEYGVVRKVLN